MAVKVVARSPLKTRWVGGATAQLPWWEGGAPAQLPWWQVPLPSFCGRNGGKVKDKVGGREVPLPSFCVRKGGKVKDKVGVRCHCPASVAGRVAR